MSTLANHSLFLQSDGTVKSCGTNESGQCGTGNTTTPKKILTTISGLTNVTDVATGLHSLFLLNDGTVKVCGGNSTGQCGTGDKWGPIELIMAIPGLNNVAQVAASFYHSLFLLKDGTVKSCGDNSAGQCGTGNTSTPKLNLTVIPGLNNVAQVAAGNGFSFFLLKDGTVKSCGGNTYGQCGTGNTSTPKLSLTAISGLTDVVQIAAGGNHVLFLLKDGTVKSCGRNDNSQCGMGNNTSPKTALTVIPGLANVAQVAAGNAFSLFLLKDGTVKSCGQDSNSQCGTGKTTIDKQTLTAISGLTDVVQISTGGTHSLFLLNDGTIKSCGRNQEAQCGDSATSNSKTALTVVSDLQVTKLQGYRPPIVLLSAEETARANALAALNTSTVTATEINTAIGLFGITAPTYYTTSTQNAIALLMPKLGDSGFTDYTTENLLSRLVAATNTAKNNAKPSILAALNSDTVTVSEINTAITIFDITPPVNYTVSLQEATALLMPKASDTDFINYTETNFEERLTVAANIAKEKELALIALNTGIVIPDKINTAVSLLNVKAPKNYMHRTQKAVAEHMPKKGDAGFTDYTPENFQVRLDAATEKAEKKHKETKRLYNFLSKFPSMKI